MSGIIDCAVVDFILDHCGSRLSCYCHAAYELADDCNLSALEHLEHHGNTSKMGNLPLEGDRSTKLNFSSFPEFEFAPPKVPNAVHTGSGKKLGSVLGPST